MARTLRGDHDHVDIGRRHDLVVMDVEPVGERQRGTLLEVRGDIVAVDVRLGFVRQQDHHHVGRLDRFADFLDRVAGCFGLFPRGTVLAQADDDIDTGFLQVLGVGMALRTVTDDGHFLVTDDGKVGVLVVINFHLVFLVQIKRRPVRSGGRGAMVVRS